MRVSLNWLKEYVSIDISPSELSSLLTMSGLEVESLEPLGQSLRDIIAVKILSVKPHPEAERLFICEVDTGKGRWPTVSSAPNLEAGLIVPLAPPGTILPGGMVVEEAKIKGQPSVGMLLAEDEMSLTDDHSGIMVLPAHLKPGDQIVTALPLEDWAFDMSITPNRPDLTSVVGIAREIAALTGKELKRPEIEIKEADIPIENMVSVTIEDPEGCPRYAAGMIQGVTLKPSPFWLRSRLHVSGIRSINNVVDITNYIMLEMGQPLHAFDYDRLRENRIVVRRADEGEIFTTLDGQTHTLDQKNLMICDGERAVAMAGIMGGLNSEIFSGSKNVLVESACFDSKTIRRGAKRLGLSTEASYRFERGIDIEGVTTALRRVLILISHLAGGKVMKGLIDNYPRPRLRPLINLRVDKTNQALGTSLSKETVIGYLAALEMNVYEGNDNVVQVQAPTFRVDIEREIDLIEEVARLEGYDNITVTSPAIRPFDEGANPEPPVQEKIGEIMVGLGFNEIIAYSFISPGFADRMGVTEKSPLRSFVKLLNPLSVDQSVMRTSLVPGLLETLFSNVTHGEKDLKLFEVGKIFIKQAHEELPIEKPFLAAVMTGLYDHKMWHTIERSVDFYDIKGALEVLLRSMGFSNFQFRRSQGQSWYDPDISSSIFLSEIRIGDVGQIFPEIIKRYDNNIDVVYLFELDIGALIERIPKRKVFEPFARFPAVFRDISIIVNRSVESLRVQETIEKGGGQLIESVHLFDLYEGGKLDPSEKALAFSVCYRSKEGTLEGKDVNRLHEEIIHKIERELGGRLREG
ncbi:MAG: phenylalanine--tRNA ligase subunit beta [Pseudomonadota bacterium]